MENNKKAIKLLSSLHIDTEEGQLSFLKGKFYIANYFLYSNNLYLFKSGILPSDITKNEIINIIEFVGSIYENVKIEII